jgi:hypothetical protein
MTLGPIRSRSHENEATARGDDSFVAYTCLSQLRATPSQDSNNGAAED